MTLCIVYCSLPEKRKRSESAEEMVGMDHFDYPHPMPLPTMYDHGKIAIVAHRYCTAW